MFALRLVSGFILAFGLAGYITPWVLIGVAPLIVVFYIMRQVSSVTIRQLKRLENVARSPLIAHVNISSQGLATIVAYGQEEQFIKTFVNLLF